jgi:CBS domain containing-hemolysin-like protein
LLALTVLKCILLYKVFHSIPALELKRRARTGDKRAAALHRLVAYGPGLDLLLWLIGTAAAATLVIWSARTNWWLAVIVVVVIAFLMVRMRFAASGWAGRLAVLIAPAYAWLLSFIDPVLRPLARIFHSDGSPHTGLYEKRDLLELIGVQHRQTDNRVPESDLKIAYNALTFGDKSVGKVMTPRRKVKMVGINDTIGPLLMDELHKSGFARFPVVKDSQKVASPQVVGTLYLNSLVGYEGSGKVKDLARKDVFFINEDSTLKAALSAFLKTHHHLLIVVNSFEEMVGVITLEDVLEQILGKQIIDEFENYESLRAVAAQAVGQPAASGDTV